MTMPLTISVDDHPLLRLACFVTTFPTPLERLASPAWLVDRLRIEAESTLLSPDDDLRSAIRAMLRHGGYRPSGRGKPASEYLLRAAADGRVSSINLAVDACNAISLHSGIPISVVDLGLTKPPFRIAIAAGESYVFNASGQEIALAGLVCLFDVDGPCGNAVRDSQRTKTCPATERTLSVMWGVAGHEGRLADAFAEYRRVLGTAGASTHSVLVDPSPRTRDTRADSAEWPAPGAVESHG